MSINGKARIVIPFEFSNVSDKREMAELVMATLERIVEIENYEAFFVDSVTNVAGEPVTLPDAPEEED